MRHLLDLRQGALEAQLAEWGQPKYRAGQIRQWVNIRRATTFEQMTDIPKKLQTQLAESFQLFTSKVVSHHQADDGTEKLLVELEDRNRVECVLLRDGIRRTICVSSQVGCAMGCVFCASGLDGVERNLTHGEIAEQMLLLQHCLPDEERLSHIVMMGMGEPLANLNSVVEALRWAASSDSLEISPRRMTISTVGLPPAIRKLAEMDARFNLAVSLHAPTDQLRNQIVPTNEKIGIADILSAADEYFHVSGRRLTFEYVLLAGINDQPSHAEQLVHTLRGRAVLLNVIPYNPVSGLPYRTPSSEAVNRFRDVLIQAGHTIKFRQRKGDSINAACGQLRRLKTNVGQAE